MKHRIVCHATVKSVENRIARQWVRGFGADAVFERKSEGWYVGIANWPASIFFGREQPRLQAGDRVRITVEKA